MKIQHIEDSDKILQVFLIKRGGQEKEGTQKIIWQRRYCVLTSHSLFYFKPNVGKKTLKSSSQFPQGTIPISLHTCEQIEDSTMKPNLFTITIPSGRTFLLATQQENTRKVWIKTLNDLKDNNLNLSHSFRKKRFVKKGDICDSCNKPFDSKFSPGYCCQVCDITVHRLCVFNENRTCKIRAPKKNLAKLSNHWKIGISAEGVSKRNSRPKIHRSPSIFQSDEEKKDILEIELKYGKLKLQILNAMEEKEIQQIDIKFSEQKQLIQNEIDKLEQYNKG